jgi:hypothetical protein
VNQILASQIGQRVPSTSLSAMRAGLSASIEFKDGSKVNKRGSIARRWRDGVLDTANNGIQGKSHITP